MRLGHGASTGCLFFVAGPERQVTPPQKVELCLMIPGKLVIFFQVPCLQKTGCSFNEIGRAWFWRYIFILEKTVSEACD